MYVTLVRMYVYRFIGMRALAQLYYLAHTVHGTLVGKVWDAKNSTAASRRSSCTVHCCVLRVLSNTVCVNTCGCGCALVVFCSWLWRCRFVWWARMCAAVLIGRSGCPPWPNPSLRENNRTPPITLLSQPSRKTLWPSGHAKWKRVLEKTLDPPWSCLRASRKQFPSRTERTGTSYYVPPPDRPHLPFPRQTKLQLNWCVPPFVQQRFRPEGTHWTTHGNCFVPLQRALWTESLVDPTLWDALINSLLTATCSGIVQSTPDFPQRRNSKLGR